jgi:hypothetical protein
MTPSTTAVVRISFANGKPAATPDVITVKPGQELEFEATGAVTAFQLDFREPPGSGGQEWFDSNQGRVRIHVREIDRRKYPAGAPPAKWKRIKYDLIVNGVPLDPDVIIDPN